MSISRLTRERLYKDEAVFNKLLPYARYDDKFELFLHSDASIWSIWELTPLVITKVGDEESFQITQSVQELIDAMDHTISVQFSWISTFDTQHLLRGCIDQYPSSGPGGWMAKRWVRMLKGSSQSGGYHRRARKMRLVVSFRQDPRWAGSGIVDQIKRMFRLLVKGDSEITIAERRSEYSQFANAFKVEVEGKISRLNDIGLTAKRIDGQGLINILYPLLNRNSVRAGKFKRGRTTRVPVPSFDPHDILANQVSETAVEHLANGLIKKDGRVYRSISMVKPPKQCLPLVLTPLQSLPYENILSVTMSRDPIEKQMKRLDRLDTTLGMREVTGLGRSNQKIQHQIASIRSARQDLYDGSSQIVRSGVHQTFICQNEDEAIRAASEAISTMNQIHGARGMVHEVSDLGMLLNSLPGCYDPSTDGQGWTSVLMSSRAVRLFPLWGNWQGTGNNLFLLPSLWNRELVGFDLYDSNVAPNTLISGVSGAGKSYLLCYILITMNRGHYAQQADGNVVERQPITFVFDKGMTGQPCGFEKVAKLFGGRIYEATPSKAPAMNFLARLGNTPPDARNDDYKDLIDMCADILCDMASEGSRQLDRLERAAIIESLVEAHRIYRTGQMRREIILSDVVSVMRAPRRIDEHQESAERRQRLSVLMGDYYGEGIYARFFDRPGSLQLKERFIVFDLKSLSRNPDLQRVFLKVAMLWADTVMNDPKELDARKILVFDEAHDLIGKTAAGTIETAFRLYRKRKGIVIAASQSGEDFYVGSGGQAIVQNSAHKIFLRQDPSKFHLTAQAFNLTPQQSNIILKLRTLKGIESQFYLISDIGEAALVLPLESAFYWASTNNGDDNQLFADVLERCGGDFHQAFEYVVRAAPGGAGSLRNAPQAIDPEALEQDGVTQVVSSLMDGALNNQ
jgi:hypothetical protein